MEARTTMYPQEGQLLVSISDMSMIKDIKKASPHTSVLCKNSKKDACTRPRMWMTCSNNVLDKVGYVHHQVYRRIQTPDEDV